MNTQIAEAQTATATTPTVVDHFADQAAQFAALIGNKPAVSPLAGEEKEAPISYQAIIRACMGSTADSSVKEAIRALIRYCDTQWQKAFQTTKDAVEKAAKTQKNEDHQFASRACWISLRWKTLCGRAENLKKFWGTLTEDHEDLREFIDHQVMTTSYFGRYSLMDKILLTTGRQANEQVVGIKRIQGGRSLSYFQEGHGWLDTTEDGYIIFFGEEELHLNAVQAYSLIIQKKHVQTAPATYQGVMKYTFTSNVVPQREFTLNGYTIVIKAGAMVTDSSGEVHTFEQPIRLFCEFDLLDALNPNNQRIKQCLGATAVFPRHGGDREFLAIKKWYDPMDNERRAAYFRPNGRLFGYTVEDMNNIDLFLPARDRRRAAYAEQQAAQAKANVATTARNQGGAKPAAETTEFNVTDGDDIP